MAPLLRLAAAALAAAACAAASGGGGGGGSAGAAAAPASPSPPLVVPSAALAEDDACHAGGTPGEAGGRCGLSALQTRQGQAAASAREAGGHEAKRVQAPRRLLWRRERPAEEGLEHELIFVVKQRNTDRLREMLVDRSTPGSPRFRQWLSRDEALAVTRDDAAMAAARRALAAAGATPLAEVGATFLRARAPLRVWASLLSAQFFVFRRAGSRGGEVVRAESYLLPGSLRGHVEGILKLLQLDESPEPVLQRRPWRQRPPMPDHPVAIAPRRSEEGGGRASRSASPAAASGSCAKQPCDSFEGLEALLGGNLVTPEKLRAAYSMPPVANAGSADAAKRAETSQLVFSSIGQVWSPSDRAAFQEAFGIPEQAVSELDSGAHSSDAKCASDLNSCAEANLDIQYMNAMSPWSNITLYYLDFTGNHDFEEFVVALLDVEPLPHVISISYGMPERYSSRDSIAAFDTTMAKLGLQGATVLVASGDDGAAGSVVRAWGCQPWWYGFDASWPASSAFVTGVGATMGVDGGMPEVVCATQGESATFNASRGPPMITSGGGFSKREEVPSWQTGLPPNATGRGIPDVSLAGHAYALAAGGKWLTVDGTSASSPAFAGMVSLINAERKAQGKPLVGFLNPALYARPEIFRDITEGDNRCASYGSPCCGGYEAGPGWDAATGLGVPDFGRLFDELAK